MALDVREKDYLSEREIIESVVSGNRDNYRFLVELHQHKVYAMIRRQVGDHHIACELTQESLVKAYVNLPSFRFQSAFSTWLIRIALNVTNTYFRSRRFKEGQKTMPLENTEENGAAQSEPEPYVTEKDLSKLRQAIAQLKPIYRDVVVLCCLERKTYDEAASILQIPGGTVRSRMNKAFQMLKQIFAVA
jgi:RNA polymerase sigma-70 factor, ECF subfamily